VAIHVVLPHRTLLTLSALVVVVGLGGAAYIYLPSAAITIEARSTGRSVTQNILLSAHVDEPNFVSFVLPTRIVERTLEDSRTIMRAGAQTSEDFARGSIVLVNDQDEEQPLLPKTHLRHEETGAFFLTDTPVTLPAHSSLAMTITAKEKGAIGNVKAGRFVVDKLPGSLQPFVYGESSQELTGGVIVESPLTSDEVRTARDELVGTVRERARGELTVEAGGAALRPDLLDLAIEEESVSAEVGSKTREFTIAVRVRARAFVVDENDLLSLTLLALRSNPAEAEEFVSYEPDSFELTVVAADFERGEARVEGTLRGIFAQKIGTTLLRDDNLAGLSASEVQEHFRQYPTVGKIDVAFFPWWVTTVPGRAGVVEIAIRESEG